MSTRASARERSNLWRQFLGEDKTGEHSKSSSEDRAGRMPPTLAAIDAGSNTVHLAVMLPPHDGHDLRILKDTAAFVQLGRDVTAVGAIGPERAEAAIAAVREQIALAKALGAETILGIATEGVRRAANASTFIERVANETGLRLQVITGEQEAALAYWGTTSETAHIAGKRGVIDLGGGSLELIVGEGTRILWRASLPLGGGVLRNRFLASDPPTFRELARAYQTVTEALQSLPVPTSVMDVSVCGGTATALTQLARRAFRSQASQRKTARNGNGGVSDVSEARPAVGQQRLLTLEQMDQLLALTQRYGATELTERYHLREARGLLMAPGCVALLAATERFGVERLHVSKRGIREGAMLAYLNTGDGWLNAASKGRGWPVAVT